MKTLTSNPKLLEITGKIEKKLGYEINCKILPPKRATFSRGCMSRNNEGNWELFYLEDKLMDDATICHELAHLILVIEGFPFFKLSQNINPSPDAREVISFLINLTLHIEVWALVDKLGFSETPNYDLMDLIKEIVTRSLVNYFYPPDIIFPAQALYIANGFLCPATNEHKQFLHSLTKVHMPNAYKLAMEICDIYIKYPPIKPENIVICLDNIFTLIRFPKNILQPCSIDNPCQNFRGQILV